MADSVRFRVAGWSGWYHPDQLDLAAKVTWILGEIYDDRGEFVLTEAPALKPEGS